MDTGAALDAVVAAIRAARFRYTGEEQLQEGLAAALAAAAIEAKREVLLYEGLGRIDLLCGRVGVEVKVNGRAADVTRQCRRYLRSDRLDALVLVTIRARHLPLHGSVDGKPLVVVSLAASGL